MIRAQRITSWLFVACAVVLVAVTSVVGSLPGSAWRVGVAVAAVVALVFAGRVNRMPILFLVAGTVGAARVITFPTGPIDDPVGALGMTETAANSLTGLALVTVLTLALRRRRGPLDQRDLIDALSVTISASLVSWILLASRLMAVHDVDPVVAISASVYLPIAIFLFTFIIDLLMAGLRSNRTMQIVTAAAGLNLVATVVADLGVVGLWSARADLSTAMFAATFLLFAASITHPDAPEIVRRASGRSPSDAYTPLRLSVTGACLMFPGVLLAAVDPVDGVDVAVRVVALIALVSTVLVRLLVAVHGQQETHDRMIERYQTDELTQLPTRRRFLDIVAEHLERTWRSEFQPTVIQMNLDRFKNINDSLGHDEANRVLQICGERLQAVAERFGSEIARLGGDDFALIDGNTTSLDESMERAEAIKAAIAEEFRIGEGVVFVTASLGVAIAPRNRTLTADELLRRADIATFRAKGSGRNGIAVFDDSMQQNLAHRMDVEHALYGAIERQEMLLYYQPIVDVRTGEVNGFEALMRWQRDDAIIPPLEFIPIAEETGIIVELGTWALTEALTELHGWIEDGVVPPDTTMSVNVSPRQIASPGFREVVESALEHSGVPASLLWVEVTESMMLDEPELAYRTLESVRELGVRLALDDFGTGYSSLSLLQQFPIQRIKIDRAFVQGIGDEGNDRSLVRTIIAMAQSMGLDLVAEGVETIDQLQVLAELACGQAQGFLISRPVPAEAMRSTMTALEALTSLSMFDSSEPEFQAAGTAHRAPAPQPTAQRYSGSSPIGNGASRPIGQPVL